jgi:uncharacterized protein
MAASEPLPYFPYHPDPIRTGYIAPSDNECRACGVARGFVYTGSPYAEDDDLSEALCPWCIADGSAAEQFGAEFTDDHELQRAQVPPAVVDQVVHRTPGFTSWQAERWLCHCSDACEFHGDMPRERLGTLGLESRSEILADLPDDTNWDDLVEDYEPGEQPAIYWFVCRHCRKDLYYADHT